MLSLFPHDPEQVSYMGQEDMKQHRMMTTPLRMQRIMTVRDMIMAMRMST